MRIRLSEEVGPFLTRASRAEVLCVSIIRAWKTEPVVLDFAGVKQISPSFANALFFNLLHQRSLAEVESLVSFENAEPYVADKIEKAISRKLNGNVELTAYLAEPV